MVPTAEEQAWLDATPFGERRSFDCSEAMRDLESAHSQVMRIDPHCCFIGCPAPAVVAIYDTRPETSYDEAETHSCADHVRELGDEESYAIVEKFGQPPPVITITNMRNEIVVGKNPYPQAQRVQETELVDHLGRRILEG